MGKKRKHPKQQSPDEHYRLERADRYAKLHHACSKQLHREAKVVKSFECQKVVRAIKAANDALAAQGGEKDGAAEKKMAKAQKRVGTLQAKLERTKRMELDGVVQVALRRLGVPSLDPAQQGSGDNKDEEQSSSQDDTEGPQAQHSDAKPSSQSDDPFYQTLLEAMLRHKRLSSAMDQLNEKVTEYRQWEVRREAMLRGEGDLDDDGYTGKKTKKKRKHERGGTTSGNDTMIVADGFHTRRRGPDLSGHEGASGLFIGSLSGMPNMDEGEHDMGGDYGEDYDDEEPYDPPTEKKKNRPGQRARRAKAMAIEAKKAGRTWGSSVNWREKKADTGEERRDHRDKRDGRAKHDNSDRDGRKSNRSRGGHSEGGDVAKSKEDIATMGKTWKEEGKAHPSWAAAAAQKSQGIAEFKGTKITFD